MLRSRVELQIGPFTLDTLTRQLRRHAEDISDLAQGVRPAARARRMPAERVETSRAAGVTRPDTFVVEANLSNLVAEIRAALGDDVRQPRSYSHRSRVGLRVLRKSRRGTPRGGAPPSPSRRAPWSAADGMYALKEGENVLGLMAPRRPGSIRRASRESTPGSSSRRGRRCWVIPASKNGTFLGRVRVSAPVALEDGAEIRLGSLVVTFHGPWRSHRPNPARMNLLDGVELLCWVRTHVTALAFSAPLHDEYVGVAVVAIVNIDTVFGVIPFAEHIHVANGQIVSIRGGTPITPPHVDWALKIST